MLFETAAILRRLPQDCLRCDKVLLLCNHRDSTYRTEIDSGDFRGLSLALSQRKVAILHRAIMNSGETVCPAFAVNRGARE
jgi:hypothetical protein